MASAETDTFSTEKTLKHLKDARADDGSINLSSYISTYTELTKFIDLMGGLFSFINMDVRPKVDILREHQASQNKEQYTTVQSMIAYEISNDKTIVTGHPPSGSRTLLRLHRAIEFIARFLEVLVEPNGDEKLSDAGYSCYDKTLAKFHPWLIRKSVGLAMYALPTKKQFMKKIIGDKDEVVIKEELQSAVKEIDEIYAIVQKCYADNGILDLP